MPEYRSSPPSRGQISLDIRYRFGCWKHEPAETISSRNLMAETVGRNLFRKRLNDVLFKTITDGFYLVSVGY